MRNNSLVNSSSFQLNLFNYTLWLEFKDHAKFQDQLKYKGPVKKRVEVQMKALLID